MLLGVHRRAWIALLAIACAVTPGLVARGLMWVSADAVVADVPAITPQVDPTIRPPQPVTTSATAIVESELTTGVMLLRTHEIGSEVFTCPVVQPSRDSYGGDETLSLQLVRFKELLNYEYQNPHPTTGAGNDVEPAHADNVEEFIPLRGQ